MVNKEKGYEEKIEEEFLYEKDEEAKPSDRIINYKNTITHFLF